MTGSAIVQESIDREHIDRLVRENLELRRQIIRLEAQLNQAATTRPHVKMPPPKRITFILDGSGTMLEDFQAGKREIIKAIRAIEGTDKFNVMIFTDDNVIAMSEFPVAVGLDAATRAQAFLGRHSARGRGSPGGAVAKALAAGSDEIWIVSDGDWSQEESESLAELKKAVGSRKVVINTCLISGRGSEDRHLIMKRIADRYGGRCVDNQGFDIVPAAKPPPPIEVIEGPSILLRIAEPKAPLAAQAENPDLLRGGPVSPGDLLKSIPESLRPSPGQKETTLARQERVAWVEKNFAGRQVRITGKVVDSKRAEKERGVFTEDYLLHVQAYEKVDDVDCVTAVSATFSGKWRDSVLAAKVGDTITIEGAVLAAIVERNSSSRGEAWEVSLALSDCAVVKK